MQEVENRVKDKAMFYWLDAEITLMHIFMYWILALQIHHAWAYIVAGILSFISFCYFMVHIAKIKLLPEAKQ